MINNYVPPEWQESIYYGLCFDDGRNNGFEFPCDENGNVPDDLNPAARKNYEWCLEHPERFDRFNKVVKRVNRYKENARGTCKCGNEIELWNEYLGGCECPHCGRWWNMFGQELNPPETWADGDDW